MALFQKSVLNKYLKQLEAEKMQLAFDKFRAFFQHEEIIQNIKKDKEEQFQYGFLQKLFDEVLDYTINPNPGFDLSTEFKNLRGAKKADGAILKDGKAIGVIELKSTKTKDLSSITDQAFGYKNNHPTCVYIITSNFEKLRFYINDAVEFIDFDLFRLTFAEFRLLYLCLHKDHIFADLPNKIKQESTIQEEEITKQLYRDYSAFKNALFADLTANNPTHDKLTLFKKTQKLIDRFLFVFFSEDKGLLPPNSIGKIIEQWQQLTKLDTYTLLYNRYIKYFNYLNKGRQEAGKFEIHAFNGGLFLEDELLDGLTISDDVLKQHTAVLTAYDFESEVDVNILGHIFEHSLNELDEITAELEGRTVDKGKTKRKKAGVFYTPKYITKYIIDNTVGKLCEEKKAALSIHPDDFQPFKRNKKTGEILRTAKGQAKKKTKPERKALLDILETYRKYLLSLTILDPACGSGAFLNQALDFLIREHGVIDELQAKLLGETLVLPDVASDILEHNLYGVDINEESIGIAKLSLWLRTAKKGRALTTLNHNIKCGNSLIDDPAVAGDKAFVWEKEFPKVFENGGFDVVVGNPPYVTRDLDNKVKEWINRHYQTAQYQFDFYVVFIEKSIKLLKDEGQISYITPNSWLKNLMMSECRKFVLETLDLNMIIPKLDNVFSDASVDTLIFCGKKSLINGKFGIEDITNGIGRIKHQIEQSRILKNDKYIFDVEVSEDVLPIIDKLKKDIVFIENIFDVTRGINPYDKYRGQSQEIIKSRAYHSDHKKADTFVPELKGRHIARYFYEWDKKHYISYGNWLAAPREQKYFEGDRIIFREILGKRLVSTLITEPFKIDRSLYIALPKNDKFSIRYVLGVLNSRLMAFYFRYTSNEFDTLFPKIRLAEFKKLPIKNHPKNKQKLFKNIVDSFILKIVEIEKIRTKFIRIFQRKFKLEKPSKKLQKWPTLTFADFLKELKKKKIKLSLSEESEWEEYFEAEKSKALEIKAQIDKTDKEIDKMVYELYGLTEEEIQIVENS